MARPREFDEVTVLEAAMNCFWAQGFESTSVRDLADAMGIGGKYLVRREGDPLHVGPACRRADPGPEPHHDLFGAVQVRVRIPYRSLHRPITNLVGGM